MSFVEKITSPYNFVPLSEKIYFPNWAEQVTQDIPFSDGLDGTLEIRITAKSPLFIRDGSAEKKTSDFFHCNEKEYCIPGTSVKGMVRNVLEIASFGKMQHIADKRYAIRDLNLPAYRHQLTEKDLKTKIKAGWLDISDNDNWTISPCKFAMWRRKDIDPNFGNKRMSAAKKYDDFLEHHHNTLNVRATIHPVVPSAERDCVPHDEAVFSANGPESGSLVFTGQPQDYREPPPGVDKATVTQQKHHEFFFYGEEPEKQFPVDDPETVFTDEYGVEVHPNKDDFIFIHSEQSQSKDLDSWLGKVKKYNLADIRKKFFQNRIPVFYVREKGFFRFGLAMMFRVAGRSSTADAARNVNPDHFPKQTSDFKADLADLIFGYANRKSALKGRVQFSACKAENSPDPLMEEKVILGSPKPSFYPAYLQQPKDLDDKEKYKTFLDADAKLRGWKRYPVLNNNRFSPSPEQNENIMTSFCALPENTVFTGKVRYHNLRPVELAALIWSIELCNPDYYCHSIGMAKPYGYGKIKVKITSGLTEERIKELKKIFEDTVAKEIGGNSSFRSMEQVRSLLNMAAFDNVKTDWDFSYLPDPKDFSAAKGNKQENIPPLVLEPYPVPRSIEKKKDPIPEVKKSAVSPEEMFVNNLPNNLGKALKMMRTLGTFTQDQIQKIKQKYRKELKNICLSYSSNAKEFGEELEKHKTQN